MSDESLPTRVLLWMGALSLIAAGCGGSGLDQEQMATDIGSRLALRLTEPILRGSAADTNSETAEALRNLEASTAEAVADLAVPEGVEDVLAGTNAAYRATNGYSSASIALTVVPTGEESPFCMVFAIGSDGTVVAQPAPGDPTGRCADTELASPLQPGED